MYMNTTCTPLSSMHGMLLMLSQAISTSKRRQCTYRHMQLAWLSVYHMIRYRRVLKKHKINLSSVIQSIVKLPIH